MNDIRRRIIATALALAAFAAGPVLAQSWPQRPIKLVVPWPAAGAVDMVGRALADRLTARLGQPVVVENKPGATGQIGSTSVVQAPPDGYTLLLMSATVHTVSPNLSKSFPFDPIDDFSNHVADTLAAGKGLCHDDIVEMVVHEAPTRIHELIGWGAVFDTENGNCRWPAREGTAIAALRMRWVTRRGKR